MPRQGGHARLLLPVYHTGQQDARANRGGLPGNMPPAVCRCVGRAGARSASKMSLSANGAQLRALKLHKQDKQFSTALHKIHKICPYCQKVTQNPLQNKVSVL